VAEKELVGLGYNMMLLQADSIVKLNGKYYELQGRDNRLKAWWILPFDFEEWAQKAVRHLPEFDGPSSDDIVAYAEEGIQVYYNPNTGESIPGKDGGV